MLIAILDSETDGLSPTNSKVIEIAVMTALLDERGLTIIECCGTLIETETNSAFHCNKISPELTKLSTGNVKHIHKLLSKADVVVAHNASFDRPFVEKLLAESKLKPLKAKWLCSLRDLDFGTSGKKLCHIGAELGVMMSGLHRAMADVFLLFNCMATLPVATILQAITEGALPVWKLRADVSYAEREKAKAAGFKWEPDLKAWTREVKAKTGVEASDKFSGIVPVTVIGVPEILPQKQKEWAKRFQELRAPTT